MMSRHVRSRPIKNYNVHLSNKTPNFLAWLDLDSYFLIIYLAVYPYTAGTLPELFLGASPIIVRTYPPMK